MILSVLLLWASTGFGVRGLLFCQTSKPAVRLMHAADDAPAAPPPSPAGTTQKGSVHLQLHQAITRGADDADADADADVDSIEVSQARPTDQPHDDDENDHLLTIREYVFTNDTSSTAVLAALGGTNAFHLEVFSIHVFGQNLTVADGVQLRKVVIDGRNATQMELYVRLWEHERFLSNTRDFPFNIVKGGDKRAKFIGPVAGQVRRLKRLRLERPRTDAVLTGFLEANGILARYRRPATTARDLDRSHTLATLKAFALWFRDEFPYYYHRCMHCGHSDDNACYGLVFPSADERQHEAGSTELYICSNAACAQTSRFPRYNAVCKVLETRRGRCGEYSVLMMRMLHLLGYEARWTVDWADHVWCEVRVDSDWVHVDPCEASVDEPLIYEGWGKKQTYILAYSDEDVMDVTHKYMSNFSEALARREEDDVTAAFFEERLDIIRQQLRESS